MKILNFGCGYQINKKYINCDKLDYGQEDKIDILNNFSYEDSEFNGIIVNHTMSMFSWQEIEEIVLPNFYRVLRPGGIIRIMDSDPIVAFKNYIDKNTESLIIPNSIEKSLDGKFCKYLNWYSTRKSLCTPEFMRELLERVGFGQTNITSFKTSSFNKRYMLELDNRPKESYYVEARK